MMCRFIRMPCPPCPLTWASPCALVVVLFAALVAVVVSVAQISARPGARDPATIGPRPKADVENASAFMAASMQGVIEKLRAQEKELARLHLLAQERAQESERLTEEVTRNMPTGPAAGERHRRDQLDEPGGGRGAGHSHRCATARTRKFSAPIPSSTQMLTACLRDGKTFQRGEVEHLTPDGRCAIWA